MKLSAIHLWHICVLFQEWETAPGVHGDDEGCHWHVYVLLQEWETDPGVHIMKWNVIYKCVRVCGAFILPILVLDIGLYFTSEHYSYLWHVCVCVVCVCVCVGVGACVRACVRACLRARAGVSMCVWVLFC